MRGSSPEHKGEIEMANADECVMMFPVDGIVGVGRLASRLKVLADADQIGPWHIGHWLDFRHTAIRIRFNSVADGNFVNRNLPLSRECQV